MRKYQKFYLEQEFRKKSNKHKSSNKFNRKRIIN